MTLAVCEHGCGWEHEFPDPVSAQRGERAHEQRRHTPAQVTSISPPLHDPVHPLPQMPHVEWRRAALDALRKLAATGREFTVYDVKEYGVPDPVVNHRTAWGDLAKDAHHLGIMVPVGAAQSRRPGTKGSLVRTWRGAA